jgi:His/Glu/Gln/Arg/opine family amino acid ABC transporter permease subunit
MMDAFPVLLEGLLTTVVVTLGSFAAGAVAGLPLALMRRSSIRPVRWVATGYVDIMRGVPPIAWMLLLYFGLGRIFALPPLLAAVIALGAVSSAYLAENYRAGIEAVHAGQWEAAHALGLSQRDTFARVIAPQGITVALPPSTTYLVGLLKDSAIVSVIGVTDVSFQALTYTQQGHPGLGAFIAAGVVYLAIGIPLAVVARRSDRFVRSKLAV